ncbi:MAG TPA: amylo-alpha-1,6-glucosidase [Vicinamibacterales bacterium]|nr:amylo-alpha-1,6-glucosidase [Vicinamibacterales bacterium]
MTIPSVEWLEADGLGGFASGTSSGVRSRRYHGLLLPALTPPTGRVMLVNGFEAWVDTPSGRIALSSHRYAPGVIHPNGAERIESFSNDPWPRWTCRLDDGLAIEQELFVRHGRPLVALSWRLASPRPGFTLAVRPLLSGRDYHATHHENGAFRFEAAVDGERVTWRPYDGLPAIVALSNGRYAPQPDWYRNFLYEEERARGLDDQEDLASPGVFTFDLSSEAVLLFTTGDVPGSEPVAGQITQLREAERTRRRFRSALHRAADAYLVERGAGKTIVAGYPWFTDWGRDTFIALRGLCIASGRLDDARKILLAWAGTVSEGMLPNRFPDAGGVPEFNSVDASLWYIVAVRDFLTAAGNRRGAVTAKERNTLRDAVESILSGYSRGTRFGIRADADALLACGEPGVQLTWMDAKIGDWVVTPRTGKPVEVQALWLNALWIASQWSAKWKAAFEAGLHSFRTRFWNDAESCLFDVVDVDHDRGKLDPSVRPNQILAAGGLPVPVIDGDMAARVVNTVERRLLTPMGLRSLAPGSTGYAPRYEGNGAERDARYHQGTVWPWLIGPFVEAWLRVRGSTPDAIREARDRFLAPLLALAESGGGHLPEIADADPPHTPRGCPCQAWSVGEVLRLQEQVLADVSKPLAVRDSSSAVGERPIAKRR